MSENGTETPTETTPTPETQPTTEAGEVYYVIEKLVIKVQPGATVIVQSGKPGNGDPRP